MRNKEIINKNKNYPDFHILGIDDDTLINLQNGGLDDIEEFNCNMYNFGSIEDLPDSDKAMIPDNYICKEYKNTK